MANPEHQEELDTLDKMSVLGYRLGISVLSVSYVLLAITSLQGNTFSESNLLLAASAALIGANLHIYDKKIRAVIVWSAWIGLAVVASGYPLLAQAFFCITFSGVALKESFCFKVPGLKLIPLFIGLTLIGQYFALDWLSGFAALCAGLTLGFLSIKKWQMPLHFDIGIKAKYQV